MVYNLSMRERVDALPYLSLPRIPTGLIHESTSDVFSD
jgi:hypothetical protein